MSRSTSALNVLNQCMIKIESVGKVKFIKLLSRDLYYRIIRLQSGMSRPSSAIEVAN